MGGNPYDPESIFSLGNSAITCSEIEVTKKKMLLTKGQLISKCLFGVFNFFKKMNENTSHSKGQLISKCPYEKSVLSKILTKKFPRFLS